LSAERQVELSPGAMRDLLHELQVHQIELQMQNEELRRSQLELDASRSRYFNLYDLAPVGYCSVSEAGLILHANLAAATLLGATRGTLVRQPISRFICKADQDTWYLHRKLLAQSGQAQSLELRLARPDDTQVWVQVATSTVNDVTNPVANTVANPAVGAPVMLVVLTDVNNRKLMEAAVRASEERYRALVEWSPVAMLVHRTGQVVFANPAALKMLGARTAADLDGKPLLARIHPSSHAAVLAEIKQLADSIGAERLTVWRCVVLDGTAIDLQAQSIATAYEGQPATITCLHAVSVRPPPADLSRL
jgi:PAS domain S-box-containing protein